jgi:RNA polymerase sigma-70 factor, ECF subfamily
MVTGGHAGQEVGMAAVGEAGGGPAPGMLPSDAELVARLRGGDEAAFAALLDSWSRGMLRAARAYVASDEAAEDVVQETWLAITRGIDRFEGRSSLRTWAYLILVNIAKDRGVKDSRTIAWSSLAPEDFGPTVDPSRFQGPGDPEPGHWRRFPAAWPSAETEVVSGEARHVIEAALADLPHRQRVVITLRDVDGYSSGEFAPSWRSARPTSGSCSTAPGPPHAAMTGMTLRRVAPVRLSLVCAAADAGAGGHGGPAAWRGRCRGRARPVAAALAASALGAGAW